MVIEYSKGKLELLLCLCPKQELHSFSLVILKQKETEQILVCPVEFHLTLLPTHVRESSVVEHNETSTPAGEEEEQNKV